MSTEVLAHRYPDALVLGVDKSSARLERYPGSLPENARLVRMDLADFWLLAVQARWRFARQCFFYPNPWPKPEQRLRRWPFHPVLPVALSCGGVWEVRTNWEVYAREFALAFGLLTGRDPAVAPWQPADPETLFERKYLTSGHTLWRWEEFSGTGEAQGR
jgi:tRNA G46 methylase TrmB